MSANTIQFNFQANAQPLIGATQQSAAALQRMQQAATQGGAGLNTFGRSTTQAAQATNQVTQSASSAGQGLSRMGQSGEQAATSSQRVGTAIKEAGAFIAATAGGVVSLVSEFTNLERAQFQVQRAQDAYNRSLTSIQSAQNNVNKLIAQGKTDTPQYALAVQKLSDAQDKSKTAEERLQLTQTNLNERMAEFAANIIPDVIQVVTGAVAAYESMSKAMKEVTTTQEGVNAAMAATEGVTAATGAEIGGLSAAEAAAGTAATDLGTNVNNVSTAIGGLNDSMLIGERATAALSKVSAEAATSLDAFGGAETIAATAAETSAAAMTGEGAAAGRDAIAFNEAVLGATRKAEASAVASVSAGRNALAMEGEGLAAKAAGTATNGLGGILGGLGGKLGPIALVLAAITAALVAFSHNIFGMRDGINAVGVAIGNAVPGLKGFLTQLQGAGNFITKIFGGDVPKAAEKGEQSIDKMSKNGADAFSQMAQQIGKSTDQINKELDDMAKMADSAVKDIATKFNKGFEEGPKAFRKAVADIQKDIGFNLPKSVLLPIEVTSDLAQIKEQANSALGAFTAALEGGASHDQMREIGNAWIADLQAGMADKTPEMQAQIQRVIDDINKILEGTPADQLAGWSDLGQAIKNIGNTTDLVNNKLKTGKGLWDDQAQAANDAQGAINDANEAAAGYGKTVGFIGGLPFLPISEQEIVKPWNSGQTAAQGYKSGIERANQASKDFGTQIGQSIGKGIATLQQHVKTWQSTFATMWEKAKAPGGWVNSVANAFADEYQKAKPHIDALQLAAGNVWNNALGVVDRTLPQILSRIQGFSDNPAVKGFGAGILDTLNRIGAAVGPTITNLLQRFADALSTFDPVAAFDSTVKFFQELPGRIVAFFQGLPAQMAGIGIQILNGLIQDFANLGSLINQFIVQPFLNIGSQVVGVGAQLLNAIIQDFANFGSLINQFIVQPLLKIGGQLGGVGIQVLNAIIQPLANIGTAIANLITAGLNSIKSWTLALPGNLNQLKTDIGNNLKAIVWALANPNNMSAVSSFISGQLGSLVKWVLANPTVKSMVDFVVGQLQGFTWKLPVPDFSAISTAVAKFFGGLFSGPQEAKAASGAQAGFSNFMNPQIVKGVVDQINGEFNRLVSLASVAFQQITTNFTAFMAMLPGIALASGVDPTAAGFAFLPLKLAPIFAQVTTLWQQLMATMAGIALANGVDPVAAAFTILPAKLIPAFATVVTSFQSYMNLLAGYAFAGIDQVGAAFTKLPSVVAPAFGTIGTLAQQIFNNLAVIATRSIQLVASAFSRMPSAVAPAFGAIGTVAQAVFNNIPRQAQGPLNSMVSAFASAASRAASTMNTIVQSANRAVQAVNAVRNAINSLQNRTVTITIVTVYRTVFAAKGGTFATPPTGKAGFSGVVNTATRFGNVVAGEAGPELVSVLPLKGSGTNTINLGDKAKKDFGNTRGSEAGGTKGVSVKGQVKNAQPIVLMLNGRVIAEMVQQQLLEFSDANQ